MKVAPVVEIVGLPPSTSEAKLTVNLRITNGGGGIGLVRLFLNGTAVVQDSAPLRRRRPEALRSLAATRCSSLAAPTYCGR